MAAGKLFLATASKPKRRRRRQQKKNKLTKGQYVPKVSANMMPMKGAIPNQFANVMTWSSGAFTDTILAAPFFSSFGYKANALYNPNVGGVGANSARWYAEMKSLYDDFRVYAVKVKLTVEVAAGELAGVNSLAFIGFVPNSYAPVSADLEVEQKPWLFKRRIIPKDTNIKTFTAFRSIYRIEGKDKDIIMDDDLYLGDARGNTDPSLIPKIYVGAYPMNNATAGTYNYRVMIKYYTKWTVGKDV